MRDALWVVGPIKGYGGLRPSEEGRRGQFGRIDLAARELLAVVGVVGCRSSEDHETAIQCRKVAVFPLGVIYSWDRILPVFPFVGASRQESLHEVVVLV